MLGEQEHSALNGHLYHTLFFGPGIKTEDSKSQKEWRFGAKQYLLDIDRTLTYMNSQQYMECTGPTQDQAR